MMCLNTLNSSFTSHLNLSNFSSVSPLHTSVERVEQELEHELELELQEQVAQPQAQADAVEDEHEVEDDEQDESSSTEQSPIFKFRSDSEDSVSSYSLTSSGSMNSLTEDNIELASLDFPSSVSESKEILEQRIPSSEEEDLEHEETADNHLPVSISPPLPFSWSSDSSISSNSPPQTPVISLPSQSEDEISEKDALKKSSSPLPSPSSSATTTTNSISTNSSPSSTTPNRSCSQAVSVPISALHTNGKNNNNKKKKKVKFSRVRKTELCKYWNQGFCRLEANECRFAHGEMGKVNCIPIPTPYRNVKKSSLPSNTTTTTATTPPLHLPHVPPLHHPLPISPTVHSPSISTSSLSSVAYPAIPSNNNNHNRNHNNNLLSTSKTGKSSASSSLSSAACKSKHTPPGKKLPATDLNKSQNLFICIPKRRNKKYKTQL